MGKIKKKKSTKIEERERERERDNLFCMRKICIEWERMTNL